MISERYWSTRGHNRASFTSIQLLGDLLRGRPLQQGDFRDGVVIPEIRKNGDRAKAGIALDRRVGGGDERGCRLCHHGLLVGRVAEVVVTSNFFGFDNCTGFGICDHLDKLVAFARVNRNLQLAVIDLELSRDRLPLLLAGLECVLQGEIDVLQRGSHRLDFFLLGTGGHQAKARQRDGRDKHKQSKSARYHNVSTCKRVRRRGANRETFSSSRPDAIRQAPGLEKIPDETRQVSPTYQLRSARRVGCVVSRLPQSL